MIDMFVLLIFCKYIFYNYYHIVFGKFGLFCWNKVNPRVSTSKKKKCFICFNESPLKMTKNAFYFILKALFVLKTFKFLC